MSSLFVYELAILFICPLVSFCLIGYTLQKKNKQESIPKYLLGLIIIPLFLMVYPVSKMNTVSSEILKIEQLVTQLEQEPNQRDTKKELFERVNKISDRPITEVTQLKTLAKANFLMGNHKKCMQFAGLVLEQKPYDEEALKLETLSKKIKD